METSGKISVEIFCRHHGVRPTFISELGEYGLIEIIHESDSDFIPETQLGEAEKMLRLYFDLNVNTEGIDVIMNLLRRIDEMRERMMSLQNRLRIYED